MTGELISRIAIQLEPSLTQEFIVAIGEDKKKLKALKLLKEAYNNGMFYIEAQAICENSGWRCMELTKEEVELLKEVLKDE